MQVQDFLEPDQVAHFVRFVGGVRLIWNSDICEDVGGGLQVSITDIPTQLLL